MGATPAVSMTVKRWSAMRSVLCVGGHRRRSLRCEVWLPPSFGGDGIIAGMKPKRWFDDIQHAFGCTCLHGKADPPLLLLLFPLSRACFRLSRALQYVGLTPAQYYGPEERLIDMRHLTAIVCGMMLDLDLVRMQWERTPVKERGTEPLRPK